jgi:hypothetical protein
MASLIIVHKYGAHENDEVLLNRDHIVSATRRKARQGEYTEIILDYAPPGGGSTLSITEDLSDLISR